MRRNVNLDGGTITISFVILLAAIPSFAQTENIDKCSTPLGMESGHIADKDLYATSAFHYQSVGPQFARLNSVSAWCPHPELSKNQTTYLQIELHEVYVISAISIQGRFADGRGAEFAREFSVEYYRPALGGWVSYQEGVRLPGNTDTSRVTTFSLDPVVFASSVRIFPYSNNTVICIRTELYGCLLGNDLISYSSLDGDLVNDMHYDGVFAKHSQNGGLGLLVDKQKLNSFIRLTSNDISQDGNFDVTFAFGSFRSFVSVEIHFFPVDYENDLTNNFFEIGILVSLDGKLFLEVSRSKNFTALDKYVLIHMYDWIGKFAKVQLNLFSVPLIQISEIYFKTTASNLSSKQIEHVKKFVVNEEVDCNNAWFFVLIGVNAFLIVALIANVIFWFYRKRNYISTKIRENETFL